MLKKVLVVIGVVSLLSGVTTITPLGSYARCGFNWLTQSASDAVPLEWELKRARQMIGDLQPEIAKNAKQIAREKIELARLQRQAEQCRETIDQAQDEIERLSSDLKAGDTHYTYAGRTYTAAQVRDDLSGRFDRFKTRRETYDRLQEMVAAREASVRSAGDKLEAMLAAKNQLEVEIENLQARVGSLRVAQTASELNLDDSHLSRTRDLLDDIAARIDVEEEVAATVSITPGAIRLDESSRADLLDEISSYLDNREQPVTEGLAAIRLDDSATSVDR